MVFSIIDKAVFSLLLFISLQIPNFVNHYHQFINGYYQALEKQVDGYQLTALEHNYPDTESMIEHHMANNVSSVRSDAKQKKRTIEDYNRLENALLLFEGNNLALKLVFISKPHNHHFFSQSLVNYKPGIPMDVYSLGFSFIFAVVVNGFIMVFVRFLSGKAFKPKPSLAQE